MDLQNTTFLSTSAGRPSGEMALQVIGTTVYHFPSLDSTNAFALKLLSQIRPKAGTVIVADYQTAGRGQIGRGWHSAPGCNLCLSCILFPSIRPQDQLRLSIATALAVRDTIVAHAEDVPVSVKWPNDIYVLNRKIGGILIQNGIQGDQLMSSVIGIGLNVNETAFPGGLPNPTSLILETGVRQDLMGVRNTLFDRLSRRYNTPEGDPSDLLREYNAVLYRVNQVTLFRIAATGVSREGVISHVDPHGRLVIRWEDGSEGMYQFKELEYL